MEVSAAPRQQAATSENVLVSVILFSVFNFQSFTRDEYVAAARSILIWEDIQPKTYSLHNKEHKQ